MSSQGELEKVARFAVKKYWSDKSQGKQKGFRQYIAQGLISAKIEVTSDALSTIGKIIDRWRKEKKARQKQQLENLKSEIQPALGVGTTSRQSTILFESNLACFRH